jgi:hypothetical protein
MGFLSTKGFLEKQVYLQTVPLEESDVTFMAMMNNVHKKGISNLRESLFRIVPEYSQDFHKEYKKLLSVYEDMQKIVHKDYLNKKSAK